MEDDVRGGFFRFIDWIRGMDVLQRVSVIVVALSVVSVIANVWVAMTGEADFVREKNANDAAIAQLSQQIADAQAVETHNADEVGGYLEQANATGEAIAKIQTRLVGDLESDALKPMSEFIDTNDNVWLGRWILGFDSKYKYTWRFCQSYDFDGTDVPMLWQALLDDGTIIAYAKATWNISDGLVHDIEAKTTSAGAKLLGFQDMPTDSEGTSDEAAPSGESTDVATTTSSEEVANEG